MFFFFPVTVLYTLGGFFVVFYRNNAKLYHHIHTLIIAQQSLIRSTSPVPQNPLYRPNATVKQDPEPENAKVCPPFFSLFVHGHTRAEPWFVCG